MKTTEQKMRTKPSEGVSRLPSQNTVKVRTSLSQVEFDCAASDSASTAVITFFYEGIVTEKC
jgi:hypothetical protein